MRGPVFRVTAVHGREGQYLRGGGGAVAEQYVAVQVVAVGHGGPFVADDRGKVAGIIEVVCHTAHPLPDGSAQVKRHLYPAQSVEEFRCQSSAVGEQVIGILQFQHAHGHEAEFHQYALRGARLDIAAPAFAQGSIDDVG